MRYWEIIADNLKKHGLSLGYVSAIDSGGRTIRVVDAHRGDGKRYVVRADEKLTAFMELQAAIHRQPASSQSADRAGHPDAQLSAPAPGRARGGRYMPSSDRRAPLTRFRARER